MTAIAWRQLGPIAIGSSATSGDILEVYPCADGSWRVWFLHGHATAELDTRIRNIKSKDAAITEAERWHREWEHTHQVTPT